MSFYLYKPFKKKEEKESNACQILYITCLIFHLYPVFLKSLILKEDFFSKAFVILIKTCFTVFEQKSKKQKLAHNPTVQISVNFFNFLF